MNIPMTALKDFVDINVSTEEFADMMTMSGSKVETIEYIGKNITNVVVGQITKIEQHENADKLVVCQVNIGNEEVQIVTGATNVFVGALVPVALDGATLANDIKIKNSKLRGVPSNGMFCSIQELGYSTDEYPEACEDGIYIFSEGTEIGANAKDILMIDEDVVEFEITSNRPDCYSVYGIAREASATFDLPFKKHTFDLKREGSSDTVNVTIENDKLCKRYKCVIVDDIKIEQSPLWIRHRLMTAGIRPINNFVDITNYVMLEYGQPMHAFDINSFVGNDIIVRNAKEGEVITTLDDVERTLDSEMLVIADSEKSIAIAGIIGGDNTKITEETKTVLFECATFEGVNIRLSSKRLGVRTESSGKFEKGLDTELVDIALNRALQLVEELGYGKVATRDVDVYKNKATKNKVAFDVNRVNKLLGTDLSLEQMVGYLNRLEIEVEDSVAIIPTFRPDLVLEADIAEEIGRMYGYNNIGEILAIGTPTVGKLTYSQKVEKEVINFMISQGLSECMNYSFESPKVFDKLNIPTDDILRNAIKINNPLGEDFSIMRTTTLNGMLTSLSTNYNKRNKEASLFEICNVYIAKQLPLTELPIEQKTITIGMYGNKDFYDIKGVVEKLFDVVGVASRIEFHTENNLPYMHTGRCASITIDGVNLGFVGEVHPKVLSNYSIGEKAYIAKINFDLLIEKSDFSRQFVALPKFPASKRDIAMLCRDDLEVKEIEKVIRKYAKDVESIQLFDVYKGEQIEDGYKSVAYNISFRANDRTLTEEEINANMNKILEKLETILQVELRTQ